MNAELLDIYDQNNRPTGKTADKETVHQLGLYHRTVHIWLLNRNNELLIQKRSDLKDSFPGYWDISAAGHLRAGESLIEGARRELNEELGVRAKPEDFIHITDISYFSPKNKEFARVYLLKTSLATDQFIFTDHEVSEVRYVSLGELERLITDQNSRMLVHGDEEKILIEYIRSNT